MARIYNVIESDITFERVRHMPRRTRVCSVHRQLSWACHKEIQLYEKDSRVTTSGLDRSKTALQTRFRELLGVQKKLIVNKRQKSIDRDSLRRASCPAVMEVDTAKDTDEVQQVDAANRGTDADKDNVVRTDSIEGSVVTGTAVKLDHKTMPRSISVNVKFSETAERSAEEPSSVSSVESMVPALALQRRKTMPNL